MNGYGYGRQPQMQGQGFYNPNMPGPDWAGGTSKIRDIIAQLLKMKQMTGQQEWQRGMQERQMGLQEQNVLSQIEARKPQPEEPIPSELISMAAKAVGMTPEQLMKLPPGRRNEIYIKALTKMFQRPTKPEPTLEEKVEETTALTIARGEAGAQFKTPPKKELTEEERIKRIKEDARARAEVAEEVKIPPTPEEIARKGANIRQANATELRIFYKDNPDALDFDKIAEKVKQSGGSRPTAPQGYFLDMPEKYNRALLHKRDGVATPEYEKIINDYNGWFRYFEKISGKKEWTDEDQADFQRRGILTPIRTFQEWISGNESKVLDINKDIMRRWYEIYNPKKSTLFTKISPWH